MKLTQYTHMGMRHNALDIASRLCIYPERWGVAYCAFHIKNRVGHCIQFWGAL